MSTARVGRFAWVAIYLGMILFGFGLSLKQGDPSVGWSVATAGAILFAAGAALIWARSRMTREP